MEFIRTKVALFTLAEKFLRRIKRIYYPPFRKKGMTLTKYGQELRLPSICLLPTAKQGRFFQHLAGNVLQVGRNVQQLTAFFEKLRQHAGGAALYFCAILVHCLIRHKNTYKFLILRLKQDGFGSLAGFCSVIWPDFVREFGQISFSRLARFHSVVWPDSVQSSGHILSAGKYLTTKGRPAEGIPRGAQGGFPDRRIYIVTSRMPVGTLTISTLSLQSYMASGSISAVSGRYTRFRLGHRSMA